MQRQALPQQPGIIRRGQFEFKGMIDKVEGLSFQIIGNRKQLQSGMVQ